LLHFGNGDSVILAYFHAGFTAETLFGLHGLGLTVFHLENLGRTSGYTFFTTGTFVLVYFYFKHGLPPKKG